MTLALYFDHHVPLSVALELRSRGVSVLTAHEDRFDRRPDEDILLRASALGFSLVTQDVDFLLLAQSWTQHGRQHAGVIFGHQWRTTVSGLIHDLEIIAQVMTADEMANRIVWIPL